MREIGRQYVHIGLTLLIILFLSVFGRLQTIAALSVGLIIGAVLINIKMQKKRIPIVDEIVDTFERDETRFVGYGSAWLFAGCLLTVTFLADINQIISVMWVLGIGDGVATLIGRNGKYRNPLDKKKSIEGAVAMFISALPVYFLIGWYAVPLAFVCTVVESLKIPMDDNGSIPIAGIILLTLLM